MAKNNLHNSFIEFCKANDYEENHQQIEIINQLDKFIYPKKTIINYLFNSKNKSCFYLQGNVGVGKTMLLNFVYDFFKENKLRLHFNEFMINFHDFRHKQKNDNSITSFVKNLKTKYKLIYLDEFQVTNIVDAMILGKLFEIIFSENIKVIITTNTRLYDLYKDGLQREQFLPFISIIKKNSIQKELLLNDDYRLIKKNKFKRIFYPLNKKTSFKINKIFHELTKSKKKEQKVIITKGRNFKMNKFFDGVARFKFNELCDTNLGSEDYLNIASECYHVFIEDIPFFTDQNSNQQLRFIFLIDIFYEKKISLTVSLSYDLTKIGSSKKHFVPFKRTLSRLNQMTLNPSL
jgi:cell division protein ZapE